MADSAVSSPSSTTKYQSSTKGDKTSISLFASRRTAAFAYAFTFAFVACSVFLIFNPSSDSSPPLYTFSRTSSVSTGSIFSSIFTLLFPNSSSSFSHPPNIPFLFAEESNVSSKINASIRCSLAASSRQESQNQSRNYTAQISPEKVFSVENEYSSGSTGSSSIITINQSDFESDNRESGLEEPRYAALASKDTHGNLDGEDWLGLINGCNVFDGKWIRDDSYPMYPPGSCPVIDEPFNCFLNNRPDNVYEKYRWQPNDCNIPRLNGKDMLELLRGKRLVFVGDSLNRNMWESLVCILRNSVEDKSRVFEASGRHEFGTEGSYSYIFKDYDSSIEFYRSPFLVQEWEMQDAEGIKKTLRLDMIEMSSYKYKSADIIVFNTGHWWTHEKTSKGKGYYQEGDHIYDQLNVKEAFRKALITWASWVDANVDAKKTLVFFRGYSVSHFRGGRWNSGGQCDGETEPIQNEAFLGQYPSKMRILESVMKGMNTPIIYLNITRMTDFRKDGHPSIYRKPNLTDEERRSRSRYQDCSHWCLPGIPDTWNEFLYAHLLTERNKKLQQQNQ